MNKITYAGGELVAGERINRALEIIIPRERGRIYYGDGSAEFSAGYALVIPPKTRHTLDCADGRRIVMEQALTAFRTVTILHDDGGDIAHAAAEAEKYFNGDKLIIAALGDLIAGYLTAFGRKGGFSPVVEIVREQIEKGVSDSSFRLDDAIKTLPLNYDYVRKLFKSETGVTPREYLLNERMKLARELILSGVTNRYSEYTVSQIAEACGFSEPLYFSRVFKKFYGVPPTEYGDK